MSLNTGIEENRRVEIAKSLSKLLAETYTLIRSASSSTARARAV